MSAKTLPSMGHNLSYFKPHVDLAKASFSATEEPSRCMCTKSTATIIIIIKYIFLKHTISLTTFCLFTVQRSGRNKWMFCKNMLRACCALFINSPAPENVHTSYSLPSDTSSSECVTFQPIFEALSKHAGRNED